MSFDFLPNFNYKFFRLTFNFLLDNVQLSEMELINELKKKPVIMCDGKFFLILIN